MTSLPRACCCDCVVKVLSSFTTHRVTSPVWDLTPFQGEDMALPGSFWRLIEIGSCFPEAHPWIGFGCVDSTGTLDDLPDNFTSDYDYNGYMELQIGCEVDATASSAAYISWPGACQIETAVFACGSG